jgi:hypothetical protein
MTKSLIQVWIAAIFMNNKISLVTRFLTSFVLLRVQWRMWQWWVFYSGICPQQMFSLQNAATANFCLRIITVDIGLVQLNLCNIMSQDGSISKVTGFRLDGWDLFLSGGRKLFLCHHVQSGSRYHSAFHPAGNGAYFHGSKAVRAWSYLTSI